MNDENEKALLAIWNRGFREAIRRIKDIGASKRLTFSDRSEPIAIYVFTEDDFPCIDNLPKSKSELSEGVVKSTTSTNAQEKNGKESKEPKEIVTGKHI